MHSTNEIDCAAVSNEHIMKPFADKMILIYHFTKMLHQYLLGLQFSNVQWFSIRIIFPYFYIDVIFVNVNLPHSRALSLSIASVYALCMFSFCSSNFHSHPMNSLYLQLIQFVHLCTKRLWFYSLIANVCLLYNLMRIHSTILNNNGVCLIIRHITIISSHFWLHDTKLVIMPIFHKAHHTAHVLMCILHNIL